jgi:O-methyltransferase
VDSATGEKVEDRITGTPLQAISVSHSLCGKERLEVIANYARQCIYLPGEFWEMGVYLGGSASLIGRIGFNKTLRLFDSFEGVSDPCDKDYPVVQLENGEVPMWAGEWHGDMKRAVLNIGRECEIHKGWIPDTFAQVPPDVKVAFCHCDVDLFEPTKASLEFVLPRLCDGGYVVVDDWDYPRHPGIRMAIEELLPVFPALKGRVEVPGQIVLRLEK